MTKTGTAVACHHSLHRERYSLIGRGGSLPEVVTEWKIRVDAVDLIALAANCLKGPSQLPLPRAQIASLHIGLSRSPPCVPGRQQFALSQ